MIPIFIFVLSDGSVWATSHTGETPSGTILATYRVNSNTALVKCGTVSGNSGSYAASGNTGKTGTEIHAR